MKAKAKIPRKPEDLDFPVDCVYMIDGNTYFVTLDSRTGAIIAKDYDKDMRCFFASYFKILLDLGEIKLMDNGKIVEKI